MRGGASLGQVAVVAVVAVLIPRCCPWQVFGLQAAAVLLGQVLAAVVAANRPQQQRQFSVLLLMLSLQVRRVQQPSC